MKFKNIKMKSNSEKLISPVRTKIPTLKYYEIFKNIFHKSPWPICLLNTNGDILDINSSCEKLLEIDKEKFIGRSNILKDKFLLMQNIDLLFKEVITSKSTKEFSFYYYKYRGKTFANGNQDVINDKNNKIYISGVIHPLLDSHGNVQYFFGEFADKTKEVNLHKINALGGSFGNDYNLNIENTYKTIQKVIPGICLLYSTGTHRSGSGIHWYNNIQTNTNSQDILNFWYQYIKDNPLIFISGNEPHTGHFTETIPDAIKKLGINSYMFIPLNFSTSSGSLCVLSHENNIYEDFEKHFFSTLAQYLVTQYQKRELIELLKQKQESLEKRSADLELIKALNEAGNTRQHFSEVALYLYQHSKRIFNEFGYLFIHNDKDKKTLTIKKTLVDEISSSLQIISEQSKDIVYNYSKDEQFISLLKIGKIKFSEERAQVFLLIKNILAEHPSIRHSLLKYLSEFREFLLIPVTSNKQIIGFLFITDKIRIKKTDEIRLQSVAGTLAPIFEKFQAREKLLTSELKYRGLVENSNDGILILQDEDIVFTNAKMADLLLVSRDKLIDTPFVNYLPDEEKEKIRLRHKNRLLGHYEPAIYESTILQSNGEKVPVEINASLSHDINKKPAQVIIVRDLRERKKEEEARTNLLIQSEKLKSLNTMATSVAHNFNNSLQTILGSLELVMQEMDTENPASKILQMAKNSADKAQDMGKLMLTYVGYNTGSYSKFNINNLLQTEFEFYQKKFPNISMTITLQENALMLRCNESQIRQVIQNIFNNAGEALEDSNGEIQVCCRLEHCTPETSKYNFMEKPYPKKCISLKIFDTGMGMESTIIERIFDPYFTTKFTGRGIGLAVVQGIMRGHKGAIKLSSEVNIGTEVKLLFPY